MSAPLALSSDAGFGEEQVVGAPAVDWDGLLPSLSLGDESDESACLAAAKAASLRSHPSATPMPAAADVATPNVRPLPRAPPHFL